MITSKSTSTANTPDIAKDPFYIAVDTADADKCLDGLYGEGPIPIRQSFHEFPRAALMHWQRRNWGLSLPYFLASKSQRLDSELLPVTSAISSRANGAEVPLEVRDHDNLSDDLGSVLARRRSIYKPPERQLDITDISVVLDSAIGSIYTAVNNRAKSLLTTRGIAFRYFMAAYNVTDLQTGVYEYDPNRAALLETDFEWDESQLRSVMQKVLLGQASPATSSCTLSIVADFPALQSHVQKERGLRDLYLDSGRLSGRIVVALTAVGAATHITPASADSRGLEVFGLDTDSQILFNISAS